MTDCGSDSESFEALSRELLNKGFSVRFEARGASMSPVIRDGEVVVVTPVIVSKLGRGDIVLTKGHSGFRVHRLVMADHEKNLFITRGDCGQQDDPPLRADQIFGIVLAKEVRLGRKIVPAKLNTISGQLLQGASRVQRVLGKMARKTGLLGAFAFVVLFGSHSSQAQVAVDASSSGSRELTGNATRTLNVAHTTTATGTNLLMVVGVSINITNANATAVTGITYNGAALTSIGAHNDAGQTRRVEMWYLLAPSTGNHNVAVSVNIPANQTVGVVAGVTTFSGVDQTVPVSSFVSGDGAGATYSQLDVPSSVNGMVMDTLAIGGPENVTVPAPQVSQWNLNSSGFLGAVNDPPDVTGSASTRTGAPNVPISETFSANTNWSYGAVSINPTAADIGVTTSVGSAVFVGSNTTYTITVSNKGTSAANAVKLTDTLAPGMTLVSVTPSTGTCVTASNPITCTIGTMASGATATITVVESASSAGSYANTAVVSDSGTPPDPNPSNNTYVSVATVQVAACAGISQAQPGPNLTNVLNTYYPGSGSVAAGATSIPVGTATGAGAAIAAGNLLLVIQMQDAGINDSNTVAYGNGYTGQGFTALNSAGEYEFVTATGAVSAGAVPITGAGAGGGLVFAYHAAAWSASSGQKTYQVIVVPQYTTATFSATTPPTALAWNGSTGGVLAIDASSTITLNGATISVDGLGFRGGAGMQLSGGTGAAADYWQTSPAAYTGATGGSPGIDGSKGEGIAGTSMWLQSGGTFLHTATTGYPSGTTGLDGSMAHGAPGNAGGGGTDGDAVNNDQNAGGGGGGNGGGGGFGGDTWNSNYSWGGEGGGAFPATINRVAMGGGGGAGSRNNSDGDNQASSGAAGGGIILIRASALSGTATLSANGASAYNGTLNDAGGGAGAGGSIILLSAGGGEGGVTMRANGGRGGDAWDIQAYSLGNRHGPGGGAGGGVVLSSGTPASISVSGGANGTTLNPGVAYGATSGMAGTSATNQSITQTSGTLSGAQCTPDVTLTKSHTGNFTRGSTATYIIPVQNVSSYGSTNTTVTINDTLPVGLTPISASGSGWTCSISGQTVSCVQSATLAPAAYYPSITITANVLQTAPSTVTNTAYVSGGGEVNYTNDSFTDSSANVVSSADLSVSDTASPNPVAAGSNITYTQTVTNNGPSAADNATFSEAIPANTTFVSSAAPAGWTCSTPAVGATGNIVCTSLNLNGGTAAAFTLVTKVNTGVANGTVITDMVSASSSATDPNTANNTASASTVVGTTAGAEMVVTNMDAPNPVVAGSNITYTQVFSNVGSSTATNPSFTENTPANTTFVSISPPPGTTCTTPPVGGTGAITCTAPAAPAGSSGTVLLVVQVNPGTASGTVITDTANVTATNQSFGTNSATATDVVASSAAQSDVALTTTATPTSYVYPGNDITYTQAVSNNGPGTASNVTFTEAIPANATFASISVPAGFSCTTPAVGATGTVTCTAATLASGSAADILVVVNVPSTVTAPSITANSSVTSTSSDPNLANNSTTVTTPVAALCDLAVTDSGTPSPVTAGNNITYSQVVTNSGPSNCAGATFTEAIPANTTFVSLAAPAGWTCTTSGSISCTNPSVAPGTSASFPVIVKVNAGTAQNTIITDSVTVATTSHDTNSANNTATSAIGVAGATEADLSITNSASPAAVAAGGNITYTQTVTNNGPATASGTVTVSGTLPPGTTFVSLTPPAGWTCSFTTPNYTCTIASLAVNASAAISFVVNVPTTATSGTTIPDSVSVSSGTADPNNLNNTASTSVVVANSADLSVTNSANPVPVQAGNNITYTQIVTNAGPSAAMSATFTESTPPNTTFVSIAPAAGWSCTTPAVGSTGTITCTNPSDPVGSGSFTLVLQVPAGTAAGTAINDTVVVGSSTTDPNNTNNTATASDVVATATQADLVVTNVATPASVAAGSNVTYTQSVTNNGPAAATSPTFTEVTPPNTTFQSIVVPTGWTCTTPAVGAVGTISCTDSTPLLANNTANFTVALQVNPGTAPGTSVAETATASAANIVPNLTTNSATATVVVAGSTSADLSIVKTASPNPIVTSGSVLVYTLVVTNNGPATATNVVVTDPLPSNVNFLSVNPSSTCSEAGGSVTCLLGSLANGANSTITILTLAGAPGSATNTASVTADQTDPNLANNSSTQVETIVAATAVRLKWFIAQSKKDNSGIERTVLQWSTGDESHNFGFNLYREENGQRIRINSSVIAGSALLMSGALPRHSGKTYSWFAPAGASGGSYWLEDIDTNGVRTLHGPASLQSSSGRDKEELAQNASPTLNQLNQNQSAAVALEPSHRVEKIWPIRAPSTTQQQKQFDLAARKATKIFVKHEGWYRITQPELIKSGLDPNVDPALLHLYAEAVEQPMQVTGATAGLGGFGPQAAIYFYGTGIDTPYSGTRVYWLAEEPLPGERILRIPHVGGSAQSSSSFPFTVALTPHTTYFSALITLDGNNFFGDLVSNTPLDQTLQVSHLDPNASTPAHLEVILQGVIMALPHDVALSLNGAALGDITYTGQGKGTAEIDIPSGVLLDGANTLTLTSQNGEYDTSLVQSISITYAHTYAADVSSLVFSARSGEEVNVTGFDSALIDVIDITDSTRPTELTPRVQAESKTGLFSIKMQIPWFAPGTRFGAQRTLMALTGDRIASPVAMVQSHPSNWHSPQPGSQVVIVSALPFTQALDPVLKAHQAAGISTSVIPVSDLYDEFSFGQHDPSAIRAFLQTAAVAWRTPPQYLLLNGRASLDPRNYLGFGHLDFVPTKIVPTASLMTASDDWFSDFTNSGMPTLATGRLPVSTLAEAELVAGKIGTYEGSSTDGPWNTQALMVADQNDTENFIQDSQMVQSEVPPSFQVTDVFTSTVGVAEARSMIVSGINSGQSVVNYVGHGSEEEWSGTDLFDTNTATALTNGDSLPVFLIMNCLNGFFQDVYQEPLAVSLMLSPNGGAVAVLASSGLNAAPPQIQLDKVVIENAMRPPQDTLGDAILKAKAGITDLDVRRTYNLMGDPVMKIKSPTSTQPR